MDNFIPIEKQSKKSKRNFYLKKRGTWSEVDPVSRVVPNKKAYNRKKLPKNFDSFEYVCTTFHLVYLLKKK